MLFSLFPFSLSERLHENALRFGLLCGVVAAMGWGIGLAASYHGISVGFRPTDLAFIRYVVAAPILLILYRVTQRPRRLTKIKVSVAATLALCGGPLLAICIVKGSYWAPFASGILMEVGALAVGSIGLAKFLLGEKLGALRTIAVMVLSIRLAVLLLISLTGGSTDAVFGMAFFAAGGLASATFAALASRWRIDPITAMTIVTWASLVTFGPYYIGLGGLERLSGIPWPFLLEQMVCQGLIAGSLSWIGFLYAARILGLVTCSFMPAITPAVVALLTISVTREAPTVLQWSLIALSAIGAFLLVAGLHVGSPRSSRVG